MKCVLIIICVSGMSNGNEYLVKKGWYKTAHKGPKIPLVNIRNIDDQTINATDYLRISGRITRIPSGAIKNLPLISTLKLTFCGTQEITPGAFENVKNLATLALSDNEITHIRFGVFNNLNITVLFLQRNEIKIIDSSAFDNMPNLFRIKLNSNQISTWDSEWFRNTPRITELIFRRNNITEIPAGAFHKIKGSHVFDDHSTIDTKIYLSKNKISKIDPNAFQGFQEFSQLWLDRNEISVLDVKIFDSLLQIGGIYLGRNRISQLPDSLFPNLKTEVMTLDLIGNNNLTCISYNIISKVKVTNLQSVRKLDCGCIRQVTEKLANEKKNNVIKSKCDRGNI